MVSNEARNAERALAIGYAPVERRAALRALFALDARLRAIALAARDPTIGLMRLTWWRDALERLDGAPAPAEPLLRSLASDLVPEVTGAALADLTEAWDALLSGEGEVARGEALFRLAARVLGVDDPRVGPVGEAWGRVDLAR
ncbi:squalene/phytoene synthase family protein, partial [Sphingomonas bacterium]|uniref:squalene/phytoene synthase family protein n=1 Tax=Sphingomonas bacterium TaxID=1895847 RepID=UPI001C2CF914